ncbi:methyltransferase [Flavobacteriaceae bacterium]|nr:methyltransferase [Flavobacteriaceae bacterium]
MNKPFYFKEFTIDQDKTAMKVGTDAVLLGAWCSLETCPDTILDVGSGTGLVSLMLAQRSDAETIDAVEIDPNAYEQSVANFEKSDWSDRLFCYHCSYQDFSEEMKEEDEEYDLIISNPPFYNDNFETNDSSRNTARFTSALSFKELLESTSKILSDSGVFTIIIPFKEEVTFVSLAEKYKLFLNRVCRVRGTDNSETKRSMLEFSFHLKELEETTIVIEKGRHEYTKEYVSLTKDFYLKM